MPPVRAFWENRRGAIMIWFALFLLLTLMFISIGIDIAKLAAGRTQLQNAADAAALAAASAVDPLTGTLKQPAAITKAQDTAQSNKAFINDSQPVLVDPADVTFPQPDQVKVVVHRTGGNAIVTHFAQVLGIRSLEMNASAIAQCSPVRCPKCMVPTGLLLNGQTFVAGQRYSIKRGPGGGFDGNYGYLALPNCPDTPQCTASNPMQTQYLTCLMQNGYCCGVCVGDAVNVDTGIRTPVQDGCALRWAADIDQRNGITYAQYAGNGQRVVVSAILANFPPGTSGTATVAGFATFFLTDPPDGNGNVFAEYLYGSAAGTPGGTPAGGAVTYVPELVQ